MFSMTPEILRNALVQLYGEHGYITKFSTKIGRRRQTVHRWLRGEYPIPLWAIRMVSLLINEKKLKEDGNGQRRTSGNQETTIR